MRMSYLLCAHMGYNYWLSSDLGLRAAGLEGKGTILSQYIPCGTRACVTTITYTTRSVSRNSVLTDNYNISLVTGYSLTVD